MTWLRAWAARDPGLALVVLAMILAAALYTPTLGTGIVSYDDPWLYQNNFVVQDASWDSIVTIFTDLDPRSPLRHTLAPEYLPVRDLSVMLDFAIWGDFYPGFHLTNVLLYLVAIAMLFRMLVAFGFDRTIVGLAVFVWALHPSHAESVAWLSERKGLLGIVFAATAGFAYARFRAGHSARWLIVATLATVAAVWSKAPAAFTIAALAGLELVQPANRVSWKRSIVGLATIAAIGVIAYLPVLKLAIEIEVVGDSAIPGEPAAIVVGVHGHYIRLAAMLVPNAISYPISSNGAGVFDLVLGGVGLLALAAVFVPRFRARPELRAGAMIWLFAWLPVSHLVLPLHQVGVADRYALVMVLGFGLSLASGVRSLAPRFQVALVAVIALAAMLRTLDARATWATDHLLWERAVASNPDDSSAWSSYAKALEDQGLSDEAERAVEVGLAHRESARLLHRRALFQLARGNDTEGLASMRRAAEAGDVIAMGNMALLLLKLVGRGQREHRDEALAWGRKVSRTAPMLPHARRSHGMVALALGHTQEALDAFAAALALQPSAVNRYNVGVALLQLDRPAAALPHFEACLADPEIGRVAREKLDEARRRLRR